MSGAHDRNQKLEIPQWQWQFNISDVNIAADNHRPAAPSFNRILVLLFLVIENRTTTCTHRRRRINIRKDRKHKQAYRKMFFPSSCGAEESDHSACWAADDVCNWRKACPLYNTRIIFRWRIIRIIITIPAGRDINHMVIRDSQSTSSFSRSDRKRLASMRISNSTRS